MCRKKLWFAWIGAFAVVAAVALPDPALGQTPSPPAPAACGTADAPCPLQKWMRANMGTPLAAGDLSTVGKSLDRAATLSPDATWTHWVQFAKQGSVAALANDTNGVKTA